MKYPTLDQVESADKLQLAKWHRFLPSPGDNYRKEQGANDNDPLGEGYTEAANDEMLILGRICVRFKELGGWDAALSKLVGNLNIEFSIGPVIEQAHG